MIEFLQVPNDRRYFVHKRIGRAARGFVTSGFNPLSAIGGFISPADEPRRIPPPRSARARPGRFSAVEKESGRLLKFAGDPRAMTIARRPFRRTATGIGLGIPKCFPPFRPDPVSGKCKIFVGTQPGRDDRPLELGPGTPIGDVVMGRYGAGEVPGSMIVDRAVCRPGMVVGDDGICYNKSQISNKERQWPRGRRPLLSGGEMRAISIASRAGRRLTNAAVRLHEIGLIKKPIARKPRKKS